MKPDFCCVDSTHAVLAREGSEVWEKTYWISVLQRRVFGFFERRKFKTVVKNIAEWMLRVVYTSR